jgi:hypothetical protein
MANKRSWPYLKRESLFKVKQSKSKSNNKTKVIIKGKVIIKRKKSLFRAIIKGSLLKTRDRT